MKLIIILFLCLNLVLCLMDLFKILAIKNLEKGINLHKSGDYEGMRNFNFFYFDLLFFCYQLLTIVFMILIFFLTYQVTYQICQSGAWK